MTIYIESEEQAIQELDDALEVIEVTEAIRQVPGKYFRCNRGGLAMKILSIDAWGNRKDGYEWNNWFHVGDISKADFEKLDTANKAVLTLAAGCGPRASRPPEFQGAPVILFSIDTLRADHLPAYGYSKIATPNIDALQRDSILFENAYSQVPLTLPSHVSMLSVVPPAEHGVRDNLGYRFDASRHPGARELLARAGYSTAAFVSAFVLRAENGFAAGFRKFDAELEPGTASDIGNVQRPGRETVARAKQWLAANAASRFFLMVHLYEPHTPWEPDPAFRTKYRDPYDGEVATVDALVGDLMAELHRLGLYERSLVLLVSDHGEGLGDHGAGGLERASARRHGGGSQGGQPSS